MADDEQFDIFCSFVSALQKMDGAYTRGIEEELFKVGFCLPAGPYVTDDDVRYIIDCIKEAMV